MFNFSRAVEDMFRREHDDRRKAAIPSRRAYTNMSYEVSSQADGVATRDEVRRKVKRVACGERAHSPNLHRLRLKKNRRERIAARAARNAETEQV